jgi:uncharacterized membrane protein YsdA (DUF1294 family)
MSSKVTAVGKRRWSGVPIWGFVLLLIIPVWGLIVWLPPSIDWLHLILAAVIVNLGAVSLNLWDKRQAEEGGWRISERALHLFELLGGWPGAWLTQRAIHHKTAKRSYRVWFWLIVFLWQLAGLWALGVIDWLQSLSR